MERLRKGWYPTIRGLVVQHDAPVVCACSTTEANVRPDNFVIFRADWPRSSPSTNWYAIRKLGSKLQAMQTSYPASVRSEEVLR